MKEDIDVLTTSGHALTENIACAWACQMAEHTLRKGNIPGFVDCLRIWVTGDETRKEDETEFDVASPKLWTCAPTEADEAAAQEDPGEKPSLPQPLMEWTMARAFDTGIREFPAAFLSAFGCNAFYQLIKTDLNKAVEVCSCWLKVQSDTGTEHLGAKAQQALETTNVFCKAVLCVMVPILLTPEAHDAFTTVFMPALASKSKAHPSRAEFFRLMSFTLRKQPT